MAKEVNLYYPIMDFTADMFARELSQDNSEPLDVYINSGGGEVFGGWSMANRVTNYPGKTTAIIEGAAYSMAAAILPFFDTVKALNVSDIMIHKGRMRGDDEETKTRLKRYNTSLRAALEKKVNQDKFKEVTGYTLDDVFSEDENAPDVYMSAMDGQKIGLVDEVIQLTDELQATINNKLVAFASPKNSNTPPNNTPPKKTIMDINELKTKHPELYDQVKDLGAKDECDRVMSWRVWDKVDPKAVDKGIESGKQISQKQLSEFSMKYMAKNHVENMETDTAGNTATPGASTEPGATPESQHDKEVSAFEQELKKLRNK